MDQNRNNKQGKPTNGKKEQFDSFGAPIISDIELNNNPENSQQTNNQGSADFADQKSRQPRQKPQNPQSQQRPPQRRQPQRPTRQGAQAQRSPMPRPNTSANPQQQPTPQRKVIPTDVSVNPRNNTPKATPQGVPNTSAPVTNAQAAPVNPSVNPAQKPSTLPQQQNTPNVSNAQSAQPVSTQKQIEEKTNKKKSQNKSKKSDSLAKETAKKKKAAIIVSSVLVGLVAIGLCLWFFVFKDMIANKNADPVYVNSVGSIAGLDVGTSPKYAAVVEPQKTININKDETRTVQDVPVVVGQEINAGELLFTYNTEEIQIALQQAELELEGITNRISVLQTNITNLQKERDKASSADKLSYTLRIQSAELEIKEEEYNTTIKRAEIDKIRKSLEESEVYAEEAGVIKSINLTSSKDNNTGQTLPFMTILATGQYRVKGTVSEQNLSSIFQGQPVVIYSRVDPLQTWNGTIESIDFENPVSKSGNDMMIAMGGAEGSEKSSKYNFYVALNTLDGLILGQHVYIEPDNSDEEEKTGIWLPAFYIAHDEKESFVWAMDENSKLERRPIILGEYDEKNDLYQILSGLSASDYIAYPTEELRAGMPTIIDRYVKDDVAPPIDDFDNFNDNDFQNENSDLYNNEASENNFDYNFDDDPYNFDQSDDVPVRGEIIVNDDDTSSQYDENGLPINDSGVS